MLEYERVYWQVGEKQGVCSYTATAATAAHPLRTEANTTSSILGATPVKISWLHFQTSH